MTWELAESGNEFITSIINGADLVPTFSAASMDDLRAEVMIFSFYVLFCAVLYENLDYLAGMSYLALLDFWFPSVGRHDIWALLFVRFGL